MSVITRIPPVQVPRTHHLLANGPAATLASPAQRRRHIALLDRKKRLSNDA